MTPGTASSSTTPASSRDLVSAVEDMSPPWTRQQRKRPRLLSRPTPRRLVRSPRPRRGGGGAEEGGEEEKKVKEKEAKGAEKEEGKSERKEGELAGKTEGKEGSRTDKKRTRCSCKP